MALRNATWLLVLVSLGALLAAFLRMSDGAPDPVRRHSDRAAPAVQSAGVRSGDSVSGQSSARRQQMSGPRPAVLDNSPKSGETLSADAQRAQQEAADHRSPDSQSSVAVAAENAEQPVSVVGNPFPVSEAIEVGCRRDPADCEKILGLLERMAQEPRDPAWAGDMEGKMRAEVSTEPGKYAIRALECRKTMCALETESIFGIFRGFDYGSPSYRALWEFDRQFGYERSQNGDGNRVTVTLRTYTRR